jgi:hypothetical protein
MMYFMRRPLPTRSEASSRRRPWTRLGALSMGAHVFYELGSGVAMPFASVAGPVPAAVGWLTSTSVALRAAGRAERRYDTVFGVMNGMFLTAVLAHFIYWPKRWAGGVPHLTECEGLRGRVLAPYNVILYVSAVASVAGLLENGRWAALRGAAVPLLGVPILLRIQRVEFRRLRVQAQRDPGWWNRRMRSP